MELSDDEDDSSELSEGEEYITQSDLRYLEQSEKKGLLRKQSFSMESKWHFMFCVLTDKLWFIRRKRNSNHEKSRAGCISFANVNTDDVYPIREFPFTFVVKSLGKEHYFRADTENTRSSWLADINQRISFSVGNDVISMAEMIICDEESAHCRRTQRSLIRLLNSHTMNKFLINDFESNIDLSMQSQDSSKVCKLVQSGTIHSLHESRKDISRSMAFLIQVQNYKELHRHDLKVDSTQQWIFALFIYLNFLEPILVDFGKCNPFNFLIKTYQYDDSTSLLNSEKYDDLMTYQNDGWDGEMDHDFVNIDGYLPGNVSRLINVRIQLLKNIIFKTNIENDINNNNKIIQNNGGRENLNIMNETNQGNQTSFLNFFLWKSNNDLLDTDSNASNVNTSTHSSKSTRIVKAQSSSYFTDDIDSDQSHHSRRFSTTSLSDSQKSSRRILGSGKYKEQFLTISLNTVRKDYEVFDRNIFPSLLLFDEVMEDMITYYNNSKSIDNSTDRYM